MFISPFETVTVTVEETPDREGVMPLILVIFRPKSVILKVCGMVPTETAVTLAVPSEQ